MAGSREAKLAALGAKLTVYGLKRKAAITKEAAWLKAIQITVGAGSLQAAAEAAATTALSAELDAFLAET